ncbi:hypothetical protein [Bacteroides sp. AM10-21B]|uniref:hypothetical protein n=1 Tax=Bacteroides sp. AM10-21B TaxID=2292001 RepID=UPI000E51222E|nr:hypothetical protein [Bacteroides sp. AM10-21B]RHJ49820.1 hypothetical protein DW121_11720 [Bacteroides sp. AM10-21B]
MGVNKKIINNAFYLYLRMFLLMCISFYTSRVVLEVLGVEDFGIYNVVGGLVILLSFLNNTLITSSQRFLSYEMGRGGNVSQCFAACFFIVIVLSFAIVLICETVGLWYVNNKMIIPESKLEIAKIVFHISVLSVFFSTLRTPFVSLVISYEDMSPFAVISVLEALLKLIFVLFLKNPYVYKNSLIYYALSLCLISFLITVAYILYCRRRYCSIVHMFKKVEKGRVTEISRFAGWNILSMLSDIGVPQGINLLINGFGGVVLNAAMGIANQVTNAVYGLVSSFQMAFRPQIVKLYSAKCNDELNSLINTASKISLFLMLYLAIPFLIRTKELMDIWLKEYPQSAVSFSQLMILAFVIESVCGPLWMTIQATGKIKVYQILTISLSIFFLLSSYFLLKIGLAPITVLYNRIVLSLLFFLLQFLYLRKLFDFSAGRYCKNLFFNLIIGVMAFFVTYYICHSFMCLQYIITTFLLSTVITTLMIFVFGLTSQEKTYVSLRIKQFILNKI